MLVINTTGRSSVRATSVPAARGHRGDRERADRDDAIQAWALTLRLELPRC
jgi:hypothetical protein